MKVIKWLFISVFVLAGLVVGTYVAFQMVLAWSIQGVGSDGGAGSAFLRSQFHDGPRYYELTANMEVEGEPVEITRVIECLPYFAHRIGNYFEKRWYTNQEAMTQRLPDGSGVIIVAPRLCNEFARPQPKDAPAWKAFPDLPEDFVPLILWTADADHPEVLEGYHSFDSVRSPESRIRFNGINLRNSSDLRAAVYPQEFGVWVNRKFGGLRGGGRPRRNALNYKGLYLISLEKEQWEKVPTLKAELDARANSGFIGRSLIDGRVNMDTSNDRAAVTGAMHVRRLSDKALERVGPRQIYIDVLRELHGVERDDHGQFVYSKSRKGTIAYFLQKHKNNGNWQKEDFLKVSIENKVIQWPNVPFRYYYDASSEKVFSLNFSYLTFYAN